MLKWFNKKKRQKLPSRVKGNICLNCDAILEGQENFCPECGQRNNTQPLAFNMVTDEFFGNLLAYDSRLWNTIIPLLIKPGKIAYQYIYGKRQSMVNPFRLYLAISLIFFLTYNIFNTFIATPASADQREMAEINIMGNNETYTGERLLQFNDSMKAAVANKTGTFDKIPELASFFKRNPPHSTQQALNTLDLEHTFWNRFIYDKIQTVAEIERDDDGFNKKLFSGLSLTIFLILPIFALVLKLLYIRRKYTYMEHMVFVFYTQSVFFLFLLLFTIVYFCFGQHPEVYLIYLILFMTYLFIAMRHFYRQNWFKTGFKFFLANTAFLFLSAIGVMLLAMISFIMY